MHYIIIIIIIIYNLHTGDLKLAYMPQITMSLGYIIERYSVITIYVAYIIIIIPVRLT
jgi:hypothetical protein